jgi:ABC-2 type transport system permease protein
MVAAMVSIAFSFGQFILAWWVKNQSFSAGADWQSQILSRLNLIDQMTDFARGVVDTRTVIFYLSATFLFLFLTLRVVESRRWK